jgi:thioredoxin-related protein
MHKLTTATYRFAIVLLCLFSAAQLSGCASSHSSASESVFKESADPMQDVQLALNRAKQNNKRVLLVMGAQWCHDSRGLAENFAKPELAAVLEKYYELIYVNVGYYKDLRTISNRFGEANYFATPTVLVIDPRSELTLNTRELAVWGSADSVSFDSYLEYFERYGASEPAFLLPATDKMSAKNILVIEDFKETQSERLQYAYGILVPGMIREDSTGETTDEFTQMWFEVRDFRMALQRDIPRLYEQAQLQPEADLVLPKYNAFSWEN